MDRRAVLQAIREQTKTPISDPRAGQFQFFERCQSDKLLQPAVGEVGIIEVEVTQRFE